MDIEQTADGLFKTFSGYVERALSPILDRLKAIEERDPVNGKDGADGSDGANGSDGKDGANGIDGKPGEKGQDGRDGRDGRDGKDGRDAADLAIGIGLDSEKSYPQGSFVAAAGGLLRAVRPTSPVGEDGDLQAAGWAVVVNGLRSIQSHIDDGGRVLHMVIETTKDMTAHSYRTSIPVERGVHRDGRDYETGDVVEWSGEAWIAEKDAPTGKPGEGEGWRRLVRRGREGKKGDPGKPGEYVRVAR